MKKSIILLLMLMIALPLFAQDELLDEIDQDSPEDNYACLLYTSDAADE